MPALRSASADICNIISGDILAAATVFATVPAMNKARRQSENMRLVNLIDDYIVIRQRIFQMQRCKFLPRWIPGRQRRPCR